VHGFVDMFAATTTTLTRGCGGDDDIDTGAVAATTTSTPGCSDVDVAYVYLSF